MHETGNKQSTLLSLLFRWAESKGSYFFIAALMF